MEQSKKSSRDLRQELAIKRWLQAKGRGAVIMPTGVGFL